MAERKYWVFCDDGCKFESMTKEQILAAIQQAVSEGTISNIDAGFITKIKEQNAGGALSFWKGTEAQLNKLAPNISGYAVARLGEDGTVYLCEGDTYLRDWRDICVMAAEDRAAALLSKKQDLHKATVTTILPTDWDASTKIATVSSVAGGQPAMSEVVTATNTVFVFPMASAAYYWTSHPWNLCGIRCIEQGNGYLRFMCDKIPEEIVWINVVAFPEVGSEGESGGSPVSGYLRTSGGDMQGLLNFLSGGINMGGFPLYGLADPANDNEAARKKYVDDNCLSKTEGEEIDSSVAYSKEVPEKSAGYAKVNEIGGVTRKCTNLLRSSVVANDTAYGISYTVNSDGSITLNGTATQNMYLFIADVEYSAGKAYFLSGCPSGYSGESIILYDDTNSMFDYGSGCVISFAEATSGKVYIRVTSGTTLNNATVYPMLNEGTEPLPYEPYFEGLRSAPVTEVESVGVNIWDEEWEVGGLNADNGETYYTLDRIRGVNYCRCSPNTQYWAPPFIHLVFYDGAKKYVGQTAGNCVATTPKDAHYFKVCGTIGYGTVYKNDLCINESDGAINGKYYPYTRNTLPIPESVRPKHGINESVYDYIDLDVKQSTERVGDVDLGTLEWYDNVEASHCFFAQVPDMTNNRGTVLCAQYDFGTNMFSWSYVAYYTDKTINTTENNYVYIKDTSYTDAATFKAAMSGVMLYYELATPVVTDISDLLSADNILPVEGGGSVTVRNEYGYNVPSKVMFCTNTAASHVGAKDFVGDLIGTAKRAESDPDGNSIPGTYSKKDETPKVGTAEYWSGEESMFGTAFYDPANKKGYFYCGGRIGLATLAHGVTIPLFAGLTVTEVRVSAEGETFRESVGTAFDSDGAITIGAGVDSPATVYAVNGEFTFA